MMNHIAWPENLAGTASNETESYLNGTWYSAENVSAGANFSILEQNGSYTNVSIDAFGNNTFVGNLTGYGNYSEFGNGSMERQARIGGRISGMEDIINLVVSYIGFEHDAPELPNTLSGKLITGFTVYDTLMLFAILLFIAASKDRKIKKERQPIFIPSRPPKGFRKYAVLVETGLSPAGGTTSGVFIRLCGKLTKSPAFSLTWPTNPGPRHLFWSQSKDMFILSVPHYLGYIHSIEIVTDNYGHSPPWFLRSIRVMCMENRKCWKSKVNAWLRGDRKPFSFEASAIGALSTREYMKKVLLQNHSWTTMWNRALGSSFTCCQRCVIHWISISGAIFLAHFLMYKWPYDEITQTDPATGLKIPKELLVRGDHAIAAGVLSAVGGAVLGAVLRPLIRKCTSANQWARVDDKDDFGHLMKPDSLIFAHGAVVVASRPLYKGPKMPPYPPCVDDTILKILDTLSPQQAKTVQHMADCSEGACGMKEMMQSKSCCPAKESGESGNDSATNAAIMKFTDEISLDGVPLPSAGVIAKESNANWSKKQRRKMKKQKKKNRSTRNDVPAVSARASSDMSLKDAAEFWRQQAEQPDDFDSMSEGESDAERATRPIRTDYEINQRRRPQHIYDNAPWWDDRHRVYVAAPEGGNDHFKAVNERYDRTGDPETACCRQGGEATFGERAILRYVDEEVESPPGGVVERSDILATLVCILASLVNIAVSPFIVYQRLPLPNAHALYYLYAVVLCLVFHAFAFCTADALACALMAKCCRGCRVSCVQFGNKRTLEPLDYGPEN